ncbi:hypothetical protein [Aminicella lysinilytica]|uniref:TadE-like protein n=1 Tax=Aminicella lysinilytica TaxID=433323 RepID=A0A4R6Q651_9FIRM|nr:hypothetical protein [Aminicella lysinilytica]TDP57470.1 hypothetical protein EV211_11220 [Aminicella lysinilytica]
MLTENHTKSRKNISLNKKGSYIVEATIVVPIFIIAVLMLISIIPIISTCENITYSVTEEMRMETAKSAFRDNPATAPIAMGIRVNRENRRLSSFYITGYKYKYRAHGIDDLITVNFTSAFKEKNPLGLFSRVEFEGKLTGRAYTGSYYKDTPSTRSEFEEDKESKTVYVFPNWGKCYHNKNCTYVRSNCHLVYLSQNVKSSFHSCPLCGSADASIGTPVFCFESSGEAYHLASCNAVDRYYIEMEKDEAVEKGYMPCSKCGGE